MVAGGGGEVQGLVVFLRVGREGLQLALWGQTPIEALMGGWRGAGGEEGWEGGEGGEVEVVGGGVRVRIRLSLHLYWREGGGSGEGGREG